MEQEGEMRSTVKTSMETPRHGRRLLIRIAAWTLAVPALCAAVLVGGAVPLYLLLPNAEPAAQAILETAQTSTTASEEPAAPPSPEVAKPVNAAVSEISEAIDMAPTGATTADAAPDEHGTDVPDETIAATVIPTPRPAIPLPATQLPSAGETREVAAATVVPPRQETGSPEEAQPGAARSELPLQGQRAMVRTTAKLRSAPQGNEIGVVREGTEIVVGRCDSWCEVSADGRRGFVHASLIENGPKLSAERPARRRIEAGPAARRLAEERRISGQPDRYNRPRYARPDYDGRDYERRYYERAYRRDEDPDWLLDDRDRVPEEPEWYVEDERPISRRGPPVVLYDEPYPYDEPYR